MVVLLLVVGIVATTITVLGGRQVRKRRSDEGRYCECQYSLEYGEGGHLIFR
jgi:hypothetical protein